MTGGYAYGMGSVLVISECLTGILRIVVCLFLIRQLLVTDSKSAVDNRTLSGERTVMERIFAAGLLGSVAITVVLTAISVPDRNFVRMALETVLIAACAAGSQKQDVRMKFYIAIFYEIAVSFWQFLLAAGMGVVFGNEDFLDAGTVNGQAAVWLLHIGLAGGVAIWCRNRDGQRYRKKDCDGQRYGKQECDRQRDRSQDGDGQEYGGLRQSRQKDTPEGVGAAYRLLSGFVVFGFVAVITLSEQQTIDIPADTLMMWTVLAVVLMMSVLVFHSNRQYKMEKELAQLKAAQAELLERDYTALNQAYAVNAKLFHDFHNHIGVLRQILTHGKTEEAVCYLDTLQEPVQGMADTVWTGDETADYLINSKRAAALARNISFDVQVEFPRNTNIRSADLCAILGNLLDNALEAAGQTEVPEQRFVRLRVRRINQMLVIKVENGCAAAPVAEGGELRTTKTDGGLHGWGLKSARTAAEKYDGMVQTDCEGHIFRAVVTLSYL